MRLASDMLDRSSELLRVGDNDDTFSSDIDAYLAAYLDDGAPRAPATRFITDVAQRIALSVRQQDNLTLGADIQGIARHFLAAVGLAATSSRST
jgi:hypothetical protein